MMKLSRADFATPQMLLEEARTLLALKDYRKSVVIAERAERLAEVIEGRFKAAKQAMSNLSSEIVQLEELGLDSTEAKEALDSAKERIKQGTIEDGCRIPNYLEARIIAEDAVKHARTLIVRAQEASDEIFTAQLAFDALREMEGPIDHEIMESAVMARLEDLMQRATAKLAEGNSEAARAYAIEAEEKANSIRVDYTECLRGLASCEKTLKGLNAEGMAIARAMQLFEGGKSLLMQAKVADARDALARAEKEALTVSSQFRRAATAIDGAESALRSLTNAGLFDAEAEKRLKDAKKAMSESKYLRAYDLAEDCRRSATRKNVVRDTIGRSLSELRESVDKLREKGVTFPDEVEEVLSKAEKEYEDGDYMNCGRDMRIVSVLVGTTSVAGKSALDFLKDGEK